MGSARRQAHGADSHPPPKDICLHQRLCGLEQVSWLGWEGWSVGEGEPPNCHPLNSKSKSCLRSPLFCLVQNGFP